MAKLQIRQRSGFSDFLRLIAAEAGCYPVELIAVGSDPAAPQGVLVLDRALSEHTRAELAQSVNLRRGQPPTAATPLIRLDRQHGPESFSSAVQSELSRVKTSRLPCALLLIRVAGEKPEMVLETAAAALDNEIREGHHLTHYDQATLGLLLPGLNRQNALQKARAIQLCLSSAAAPCRVKIGLAVCLARAVPRSAEEFIAMAGRELEKGSDAGIFYSFAEEAEDSCQVTAEERAQLFRLNGQPK